MPSAVVTVYQVEFRGFGNLLFFGHSSSWVPLDLWLECVTEISHVTWGLPKWASNCPQMQYFLGCPMPECFSGLPKLLPQKVRLPLIFFSHRLPYPIVFLLFSFGYLMALWSLRGALPKFKLSSELAQLDWCVLNLCRITLVFLAQGGWAHYRRPLHPWMSLAKGCPF